MSDKRKFLANLSKLKGASDELKAMRVQHDLSPDERETTKNLLAEAYKTNQNEKPNILWYKVRGPPHAQWIVKIFVTR